jgi:hypothetical protein
MGDPQWIASILQATETAILEAAFAIAVVIVVVVVAVIYITYSVVSLSSVTIPTVEIPVTLSDTTIPELKPLSATEGTKMTRCCGRRARVPCVVIWQSDIEQYQEEVELNGIETEVDRFRIDVALALGQAISGTDGKGKFSDVIAIIGDGKVVWKKNKESSFDHRWSDVTIHLGGNSQSADSFMQSALGASAVPAFRNTPYVVIEGWRLEDFGNRIPITLSAIVQPDDDGYTLADAIADVWDQRPGADSATEIDVSTVTGSATIDDVGGEYLFEGFQQEGPVSILETLEVFAAVFDLTVRHSDGRLVFIDRENAPVIEVAAGDLGVAEGVAPSSRPIQLYDLDQRKRPTEVVVNYRNKKTRYQRATERYEINDPGAVENVVTITYDGVLLPKQARRVAKRRLIEAWRVGTQARFPLPPDYITAEAGDVFAIPFEGQTYYVRAQGVTIGANYMIEVEGLVEQVRAGDEEIFTTASPDLGTDEDDDESDDDDPFVDDPEGPDDGGYLPPLMRKVPMNLPPLFEDEHAKDTAIYYAKCAEDPSAKFKGSKSYRSWKASGGYKGFASGFAEAGIGIALDAFSDSFAGGLFFDSGSTLTVSMFHGAPTTATRAEVESGRNWIAIGDPTTGRLEVAAFTTATPADSDIHSVQGVGIAVDATNSKFTRVAGVDFTTLVSAGDHVRFAGLENAENGRLFPVVSVSAGEIVVDTDGVDPLVDEGPVDAGLYVTLEVNGNRWTLSGWFRGLRDTADHCPGHLAGDLVVFLAPSATRWVPLPKAKIGKTLRVKEVPKGADLVDVLEEEIGFEGETERPFRPCSFRWAREYVGGDDLDEYNVHLSFVHRTRFPFPDPTTTAVPPHDLHHESKRDEYRLKIYSDSAYTTLVRTVEIVAPDDHDSGDSPGRREWEYTVADQVDDGLKNAEFWVEIYQVGTVVKRGNALLEHVPAL